MGDLTPLSDENEERYEIARNTLGMLISLRAAWMGAERKKTDPNSAIIKQWSDEQDFYEALLARLSPYDTTEVERILNVHGAQATLEVAAHRAQISAEF